MVWPGSHHKCHAFLTTSKACRRNGYGKPNDERLNLSGGPDRAPTFAAGMWPALVWCNKHIVPVDAYGPAGTVVFYHSRLVHERGQNYSDNIRQAVLMRFGKTAEALPEEQCLEHARTNDIWCGKYILFLPPVSFESDPFVNTGSGYK
jgi:ectoine hydroxylase-related dioxygenase (phytanoyl-CoA dioxygenase family)